MSQHQMYAVQPGQSEGWGHAAGGGRLLPPVVPGMPAMNNVAVAAAAAAAAAAVAAGEGQGRRGGAGASGRKQQQPAAQQQSGGKAGGGGTVSTAKKPQPNRTGGRFSGRLAKKEDEELLVTECELLAPLVGADTSGPPIPGEPPQKYTLAKLVRAIADGSIRRHLEARETALRGALAQLSQYEGQGAQRGPAEQQQQGTGDLAWQAQASLAAAAADGSRGGAAPGAQNDAEALWRLRAETLQLKVQALEQQLAEALQLGGSGGLRRRSTDGHHHVLTTGATGATAHHLASRLSEPSLPRAAAGANSPCTSGMPGAVPVLPASTTLSNPFSAMALNPFSSAAAAGLAAHAMGGAVVGGSMPDFTQAAGVQHQQGGLPPPSPRQHRTVRRSSTNRSVTFEAPPSPIDPGRAHSGLPRNVSPAASSHLCDEEHDSGTGQQPRYNLRGQPPEEDVAGAGAGDEGHTLSHQNSHKRLRIELHDDPDPPPTTARKPAVTPADLYRALKPGSTPSTPGDLTRHPSVSPAVSEAGPGVLPGTAYQGGQEVLPYGSRPGSFTGGVTPPVVTPGVSPGVSQQQLHQSGHASPSWPAGAVEAAAGLPAAARPTISTQQGAGTSAGTTSPAVAPMPSPFVELARMLTEAKGGAGGAAAGGVVTTSAGGDAGAGPSGAQPPPMVLPVFDVTAGYVPPTHLAAGAVHLPPGEGQTQPGYLHQGATVTTAAAAGAHSLHPDPTPQLQALAAPTADASLGPKSDTGALTEDQAAMVTSWWNVFADVSMGMRDASMGMRASGLAPPGTDGLPLPVGDSAVEGLALSGLLAPQGGVPGHTGVLPLSPHALLALGHSFPGAGGSGSAQHQPGSHNGSAGGGSAAASPRRPLVVPSGLVDHQAVPPHMGGGGGTVMVQEGVSSPGGSSNNQQAGGAGPTGLNGQIRMWWSTAAMEAVQSIHQQP